MNAIGWTPRVTTPTRGPAPTSAAPHCPAARCRRRARQLQMSPRTPRATSPPHGDGQDRQHGPTATLTRASGRTITVRVADGASGVAGGAIEVRNRRVNRSGPSHHARERAAHREARSWQCVAVGIRVSVSDNAGNVTAGQLSEMSLRVGGSHTAWRRGLRALRALGRVSPDGCSPATVSRSRACRSPWSPHHASRCLTAGRRDGHHHVARSASPTAPRPGRVARCGSSSPAAPTSRRSRAARRCGYAPRARSARSPRALRGARTRALLRPARPARCDHPRARARSSTCRPSTRALAHVCHRACAGLEGRVERELHLRRHTGPLPGPLADPSRGGLPVRPRLLALGRHPRALTGAMQISVLTGRFLAAPPT